MLKVSSRYSALQVQCRGWVGKDAEGRKCRASHPHRRASPASALSVYYTQAVPDPRTAYPFESTLPFTHASKMELPLNGRKASSFHWPCSSWMGSERREHPTTASGQQELTKDNQPPIVVSTHPRNQGAENG